MKVSANSLAWWVYLLLEIMVLLIGLGMTIGPIWLAFDGLPSPEWVKVLAMLCSGFWACFTTLIIEEIKDHFKTPTYGMEYRTLI